MKSNTASYNQLMSVLYTLSNILVPFSLLIFQTLKRSHDGLKPSYGKWLALFLLTFIFNGLSIFGRWWILLLDLAAKCSLYFLPEQLNQRIETEINHLHLEGLIQNFRNRLVNVLFAGHKKITVFLLSKLRNQEAEQFKQAFVKSLNNQTQDLAAGITALPKIFQSTGINCTIISEDAVEKSLIKRQLQQRRGDLQKRISPDSKRSDSAKKVRPQKQSSDLQKPHSSKQYQSKQLNMHKSQPLGFGSKKDGISNRLKESFGELRQSSNIIVDDFEEEGDINKLPIRSARNLEPSVVQTKTSEKPKLLTKQVQKNALEKHKQETKKKELAKKQAFQKKVENVQKVETKLKRGITDVSAIKNMDIKEERRRSVSPEAQQQVKMIEKLDVSVSEYSDLFDEDKQEAFGEPNNEEAKQVCRVEAIVEIGAPPQSKLQIYYLELYTNGDLRIMSLYNREFQRHKLVSMTKGQNNYFELHFTEGTVNKRKVKFRGQYQPFMKYLQNI